MAKIAHSIHRSVTPQTRDRPLPGGDFGGGLPALIGKCQARWPWLGEERIARMAAAYGTMISDIVGDAQNVTDLGCDFGAGLTAREIDWLFVNEWARTANDVIWRRTKLGLVLTAAQVDAVANYLDSAA